MLTKSGHSYVLGIDPGARNLGIASSDDSVGETIDLGPLYETPLHLCVANAVRAVNIHLKDPMCIALCMEEQLVGRYKEKAQVAAKMFAVFGAIQATTMTHNKPMHIRTALEVKRHFGWRFTGGYESNKIWAKQLCEQKWPRWSLMGQTDHACDAKLLAEYLVDTTRDYEQACRATKTRPSDV